jgi:hypothetical protein
MVQNTFYPLEYEGNIKYITKDGVRHREDDRHDYDIDDVTSDEPDSLNPTYDDVEMYRNNLRQQYERRYGVDDALIEVPHRYKDKDKAIEAIRENRDNLENVSSPLWQNVEFLAELLQLNLGNIRRSIPNPIADHVMDKIRTIQRSKQVNRLSRRTSKALDSVLPDYPSHIVGNYLGVPPKKAGTRRYKAKRRRYGR